MKKQENKNRDELALEELDAKEQKTEGGKCIYDYEPKEIMALHEPDLAYNIGDKTLEDYLSLPEGTRMELIDGVFYDMAAPTTVHSIITGALFNKLTNFVDQNHGSCMPFAAPTDVQLDMDDKTIVQPDIFVVCKKEQVQLARIYGAPDFVIEIVSPSNWYVDVLKKKVKYEGAGVREYWMVFPKEEKITVCRFDDNIQTDYSFHDIVPVGIWNGKCEIDFAEISKKLQFFGDKIQK